MPICLIVWKFIKLQRALARIKRVKINAYRKSIGLPPKYGCCETLCRCFFSGLKNLLLRLLCPCCFCKGKEGKTLWEILKSDGTLPNVIFKSLLGLIVGLIFTHLIAIFLIFQLNFDPITTTYGSIFLGTFLTLGLAFSETSRCLVFLTVPQFFTKKGRAAILAYCLILAMSGPGKNTTKNMEILTESLLCSQEMAHNATQGLINLVKDPLSALGGALKSMVDAVKGTAAKIMGNLRTLINIIVSVVNAIKYVLNWLKEISSFCNKKVGSPSEKCRAAFAEAVVDCKARLGKIFNWMCSVVDLVENLCQLAEWAEVVICWLPQLIKENVFEPIKNGLKSIGAGIKTFFDVRIKFDHELEASFSSSKSFREVVHGMKAEILQEMHWFLEYMDWVNLLASLFMGLALYKAIMYRHRFRILDRHDNSYITKGIVQLDLRMRRLGRDPLFPLKYRESFSYVEPFSLVLVESERKALKQQLFFVGIAALKIWIYIFIDYMFYHFLILVRKYGAFHIDTRKMLGHSVTIGGHGFMADMYRAILFALSPIGTLLPVFDTSPCLPVPSVPNYYRYAMIFFLVMVCFLACLTEPYGMRLRHIICGIYYPERKVPRDRWLYTHIISSRENFISYARNELRSMMTKGRQTYRVGLIERISHTVPCMRKIFSLLLVRRKKCLLCGLSGDMDDAENFVHCPSCDSVYCILCYEDVGKRCVACISPIEFEDISEESGSGSSDEEDEETKRKIAYLLKQRRAGVPQSSRKPHFSSKSDNDSDSEEDTSAQSKFSRSDWSDTEDSSYESKTPIDTLQSQYSEETYSDEVPLLSEFDDESSEVETTFLTSDRSSTSSGSDTVNLASKLESRTSGEIIQSNLSEVGILRSKVLESDVASFHEDESESTLSESDESWSEGEAKDAKQGSTSLDELDSSPAEISSSGIRKPDASDYYSSDSEESAQSSDESSVSVVEDIDRVKLFSPSSLSRLETEIESRRSLTSNLDSSSDEEPASETNYNDESGSESLDKLKYLLPPNEKIEKKMEGSISTSGESILSSSDDKSSSQEEILSQFNKSGQNATGNRKTQISPKPSLSGKQVSQLPSLVKPQWEQKYEIRHSSAELSSSNDELFAEEEIPYQPQVPMKQVQAPTSPNLLKAQQKQTHSPTRKQLKGTESESIRDLPEAETQIPFKSDLQAAIQKHALQKRKIEIRLPSQKTSSFGKKTEIQAGEEEESSDSDSEIVSYENKFKKVNQLNESSNPFVKKPPSTINPPSPDLNFRKRNEDLVKKRVNPTLAERIKLLDSFYGNMPFPPLSNIYKP